MNIFTDSNSEEVEFEIDECAFVFNNSITIFEACLQNNIIIPHFCYHNKLKIAGNCRVCFVEDKKSEKPIISCAAIVSEGESIYTKTELALSARESTIEYLLINHPLDCPICDQGGECDLQDQTLNYGTEFGRYYELDKRAVENKNYSPLIKFFLNRCIHCSRCVRYAADITESFSLTFLGRGDNMEIGLYINLQANDELSGNMIDLCPVGAITSKPFAFIGRFWEINSIKSLDIFDSINNTLKIEFRGSSIIRVLPASDPLKDCSEWISDKVRFNYDSFSICRLAFPMFIMNKNYFFLSWKNSLIIYKKFFINSLYFVNLKKYKHNYTNYISGLKESFSNLFYTKFFYSNLGILNFKPKNVDFRNLYLSYDDLNISMLEYKYFLILGLNLRFESPISNLLLSNRINAAENDDKDYKIFVYNFGFCFNSSFEIKNLQNNMFFFINAILSIIYNNKDKINLYLGYFLCHGNYIISNKFNLFNFLFSFIAGKNKVNFCFTNFFSCIQNYGELLLNSNTGSIGNTFNTSLSKFVTFNYNYDEFSNTLFYFNNKISLKLYFGHHSDYSIKYSNIIIPIKLFYEDSLEFLNVGGILQCYKYHSLKYMFGNIKSYNKVTNILLSIFNINFRLKYDFNNKFFIKKFIYSKKKNNERLKLLKLNYSVFYLNNFYSLNLNLNSIINNFYLSDNISRNSIVMGLCSRKLTFINDFIWLFNSNFIFDKTLKFLNKN